MYTSHCVSGFPQVLTMLFMMALRLARAPDLAQKMRKYLRRVPIGRQVVCLVDYSLPGGPRPYPRACGLSKWVAGKIGYQSRRGILLILIAG